MKVVHIDFDRSDVFAKSNSYSFFHVTEELDKWFKDNNIEYGMYINIETYSIPDCYISYQFNMNTSAVAFYFTNPNHALLFKLAWG